MRAVPWPHPERSEICSPQLGDTGNWAWLTPEKAKVSCAHRMEKSMLGFCTTEFAGAKLGMYIFPWSMQDRELPWGCLVCVCAKSLQSDMTLCDPVDHAHQCPLSMGFSRKEYWSGGVGCCALLQGLFPTQGWNPHLIHLLHWQAGSLPLVPTGSWFLYNKATRRDWKKYQKAGGESEFLEIEERGASEHLEKDTPVLNIRGDQSPKMNTSKKSTKCVHGRTNWPQSPPNSKRRKLLIPRVFYFLTYLPSLPYYPLLWPGGGEKETNTEEMGRRCRKRDREKPIKLLQAPFPSHDLNVICMKTKSYLWIKFEVLTNI